MIADEATTTRALKKVPPILEEDHSFKKISMFSTNSTSKSATPNMKVSRLTVIGSRA
jgi:hypothetical protein